MHELPLQQLAAHGEKHMQQVKSVVPE